MTMPDSDGPGGARQRLLSAAVPLVCLAAGLLSAFHPMLLSGFRMIQTDPGDSRFIHYVLEHTWRWCRGDELHARLWDPPFFYPHQNVLACGDNLVTVAPPYWALRAVGVPLNASFGLWMVVISALNFAAGIALIRIGFGRSWAAASLGAFLIAFGNSRMVQIGHQQLLPCFYTLLALLFLVRLFGEGTVTIRRRRGLEWAAFFGCCVAQLYASYYNGYFLFLVLLIAGLRSLVTPRWRRRVLSTLRTDAVWITGAAAAGVLALVPLAEHYWLALQEVGGRQAAALSYGMARPESYLWMGRASWLYGWTAAWCSLADIPWSWEHAVGLGLATTLVTAAFLWHQRRNQAVRISFSVIAISMVLFTRTEGFEGLATELYDVLPGIQGIRTMVRLAMLLLIPAGLAVAFLADAGRSRRQRVLAAALAVFCCVEQLSDRWAFDAVERDARVAAIRREIPEGARSFYLANQDPLDGAGNVQLDAVWASLLEGVPTVNGYSGVFPGGFPPILFNPVVEPDEQREQRAALAEWTRRHGLHVRHVHQVRGSLPEQVSTSPVTRGGTALR